MSNNQGSDLGFLVFLGIAALFIIPLFLGVDNIDEIIKLGKSISILLGVLAIIAVSIVAYLFYKRKFPGKRNLRSENKQEKIENRRDEWAFKNNDSRESEMVIEEHEILENDENELLKQINQNFDL